MITQRKVLVFVTLLLLACALLNSRWTGWLTGFISYSVNTLQYPADFTANLMRNDPAVEYAELSDQALEDLLAKAQKENDALWQENEKLREQIESFEAITVGRDMTSIRMVEARVSRVSNDPIKPTMLILRGSLHGLNRDDPVAYKSNLIGFVSDSIGPANATVSLISRKGFSIGVNIKPPPDPDNPDKKLAPGWPYKTRVTSDGKGRFYFDAKKKTAESFRAGDYVRSADTILESANGFLVGTIEKIEPSEQDPLNLSRITIKPSVPIGPQRTVTILTERND
jgi:cell shape-determining protein MreC